MPGSGKPIPKGADVTQKTTTNDKGQKVTRTTVKTSGSSTDGFANDPDKKAQLMDIKNRRRERQGLPPLGGGDSGANKGVPTKDTKFATDKLLNKNRTDGKTYSAADAKRMEKSFNQRLQSEPDFDEFDNVPVVNSKGQKVKKIPGTNPISGGTKKQSY